MDDPGVDRGALRDALGYIRTVNRRLGGVAALLDHLERWSVRWPADKPVTLLDIATGSADIPLEAVRWARGKGFDLRVTGVDVHATTLELAQDHIDREPDLARSIELRRADALDLHDLFAPGAFDYAHAGLFLHHLREFQGMTVLAIMDRLAACGIVWNDLVRSGVGKAAISLMTLGKPPMIRHDARASVRAGFTRAEAIDLARRAGLDYCRYRWSLLTHRFTVAGEKPGAWA
jgi:hypothetical protein